MGRKKWRRLNVLLSDQLDDRVNAALPHNVKSLAVRALLKRMVEQLEADPALLGHILSGEFKLGKDNKARSKIEHTGGES